MLHRSRLVRIVAVLAALTAAGPAAAGARADVLLEVPEPELRQSLSCTPLERVERDVVLFLPGTTLTPRAYSGNWLADLAARGWPHCTVTLPRHAMGDIQLAAEHVVHAIRRVSAMTGRRVDVVGHSQGGMVGRWALRFWPDTRAMVDDLVAMAPSNHGTVTAHPVCAFPSGCAPAIWQQRDTSAFMATLNDGPETWPGISYTVAMTRYDLVVAPNADTQTGSSALRTGEGAIANVLLQDVCPGNMADHIAAGTHDPVAHAVALDALEHPGPADPARLDPAICQAAFMPGVDPSRFAGEQAQLTTDIAATMATAERVGSEPPPACYASAPGCPAARQGVLRLRVAPRRLRAHRRSTVTVRAALVRDDGTTEPARGAIVRVAGRRIELGRRGAARLSLQFSRSGIKPVSAVLPVAGTAQAALRVTRR